MEDNKSLIHLIQIKKFPLWFILPAGSIDHQWKMRTMYEN